MQFLVLNGTHDSVDETPDLPSSKQLLPHLVSGRFAYESFRLLSVRLRLESVRLRLKLCTSALPKDLENSSQKAFKMK